MTNLGFRSDAAYSKALRLLLCLIVAVGSLAASPGTAVQSGLAATSTLLAGYPFGEGVSTTTADTSGNLITGTLRNATWTTTGKFGNALSFNGSSSYVDLGAPPSLSTTS